VHRRHEIGQPGQPEQDQRVDGEGDQDPDRGRWGGKVGKADEAYPNSFLGGRESRDQQPRHRGRQRQQHQSG
jgi:hypothetical protein